MASFLSRPVAPGRRGQAPKDVAPANHDPDLDAERLDIGDDLAYAQYFEKDIPNYWAYAKAYGLGDHFFANVLGPSFPGHIFVLAAQAGWSYGNPGTQIYWPYWGCDQNSSTTMPTCSSHASSSHGAAALPETSRTAWKPQESPGKRHLAGLQCELEDTADTAERRRGRRRAAS
jgi:hypothetical protein